jgi:hypothetical protein
LILCGQIYGPGLGRHVLMKARGLGLDWTIVFALRASTTRPKSFFFGFPDPNSFDIKHDRLSRFGPTQFPPLSPHASGGPHPHAILPPRGGVLLFFSFSSHCMHYLDFFLFFFVSCNTHFFFFLHAWCFVFCVCTYTQ